MLISIHIQELGNSKDSERLEKIARVLADIEIWQITGDDADKDVRHIVSFILEDDKHIVLT